MEDSARPTPADSGELPNGAGMAEDAVVAPDAAEAPEEGEESGIANDSETNAALGAEGEPSRPLTMRELLGELKDSGEPSSGRSTLSEGNGIGSAGAERARSVSMLSLWVSTKLFGSRDSGGGGGEEAIGAVQLRLSFRCLLSCTPSLRSAICVNCVVVHFDSFFRRIV